MIENWPFFIRFLLTLICFSTYLFFLTPKQFKEVLRPQDWLTRLRWLILSVLLLTVITFIPSLVYQFYLAIGQEAPVLRQITSVVGGVNLLGTTLLMVLIFTYRKQPEYNKKKGNKKNAK